MSTLNRELLNSLLAASGDGDVVASRAVLDHLKENGHEREAEEGERLGAMTAASYANARLLGKDLLSPDEPPLSDPEWFARHTYISSGDTDGVTIRGLAGFLLTGADCAAMILASPCFVCRHDFDECTVLWRECIEGFSTIGILADAPIRELAPVHSKLFALMCGADEEITEEQECFFLRAVETKVREVARDRFWRRGDDDYAPVCSADSITPFPTV
jgi:hypothetical protein